MIKDNEFTLTHIAEYCGISYSRVRGAVKELGIRPKRYEGNQPIFTQAHVFKIEKRNTKPGPKTGARAK